MKVEQLITLPRRGLKIVPPAETAENMRRAKAGEVVLFSDEEKKRIALLRQCAILKRRYPTPEEGKRFMQEVDYEWGEKLREMAQELSNTIVTEWKVINSEQDIAVILFGSIPKGLVKRPNHPDPSNIDIAVVGCIRKPERAQLYDAIRPKRLEIQKRILARCPVINSSEPNPGNAGVTIQPMERVLKDNYSQVVSYIRSGAEPLYDGSGIWNSLETYALQTYKLKRTTEARVGKAGKKS